jgi:hypothetical protein
MPRDQPLNMNRVLLIWQDVPERLRIYRLSVDSGVLAKLKACHNRMLNSERFEFETWLASFMNPCPGEVIFDSSLKDDPWGIPRTRTDETIIVSGIIL